MIRALLKKTRLYGPLRTIRDAARYYSLLRRWKLDGCPIPPSNALKHATVIAYRRQFRSNVLVETGTFHGEMVYAMKGRFADVYSIELCPDLYQKAKQFFAPYSNVHIYNGDSAEVLRSVLPQITGRLLFWLDAHYSGPGTACGALETPIMQELEVLFTAVKNCVILIDDARCFNGTNSYPNLVDLKKYIDSKAPSWIFEVNHDIICIHPPLCY